MSTPVASGWAVREVRASSTMTVSARSPNPTDLPLSSSSGMAEDDDGYWWIATDVGVLRVPAGADRQFDGFM